MQIQILQSQLNKSITVTSHHSTKLQIGLINTVPMEFINLLFVQYLDNSI